MFLSDGVSITDRKMNDVRVHNKKVIEFIL